MQQNLSTYLDQVIDQFKEIPKNVKYWLVRTESGQYYDAFTENRFIALGHTKIKYSEIERIRLEAKNDIELVRKHLKLLALERYPDEKRPGLIANQLIRFIYEIKKGHKVIIPSVNSSEISIGEVVSTPVLNVNEIDLSNTNCHYFLRKRVRWIKTLKRDDLDPYLYMVLQAHQAINDIDIYKDIIERALQSFYIQNGQANLVLNVEQSGKINALQLFQLGFYLLKYAEGYGQEYGLDLNTFETEVKINLNSKGKIQIKGAAKTIFILAVVTVGLSGGGLEIDLLKNTGINLTTDGLIHSLIEYQDHKHERENTDTIKEDLDSLKVKAPADALKLYIDTISQDIKKEN